MQIFSASDLENLPEMSREELKEHHYRRGYRDGMIVFHRDMCEMIGIKKLTKREEKSYDLVFEWLFEEMLKWANGDCNSIEFPPDFLDDMQKRRIQLLQQIHDGKHPKRICIECGVKFTDPHASGSITKYCGKTCKMRAYRRRKHQS